MFSSYAYMPKTRDLYRKRKTQLRTKYLILRQVNSTIQEFTRKIWKIHAIGWHRSFLNNESRIPTVSRSRSHCMRFPVVAFRVFSPFLFSKFSPFAPFPIHTCCYSKQPLQRSKVNRAPSYDTTCSHMQTTYMYKNTAESYPMARRLEKKCIPRASGQNCAKGE